MKVKTKAMPREKKPDLHLDSSEFDAMMGRALAVPPKSSEKMSKKRSESASQAEGDRAKG